MPAKKNDTSKTKAINKKKSEAELKSAAARALAQGSSVGGKMLSALRKKK